MQSTTISSSTEPVTTIYVDSTITGSYELTITPKEPIELIAGHIMRVFFLLKTEVDSEYMYFITNWTDYPWTEASTPRITLAGTSCLLTITPS